jgi:hypothetical protein
MFNSLPIHVGGTLAIRPDAARPAWLVGLAWLGAAFGASELQAQTDYYNTDAGRPVTVEDAYATERHAFELKVASLRLERESAGVYHWELEPEIAYGVLPRTHIEVGLPLVAVDAGGALGDEGLAGLEISALHNLNAETELLPALGIRGDVLLPVGSLAPDDAYVSVTGLLSRTFRFARFHVNGRYTLGPRRAGVSAVERWLAGIAVDRAFPLDAFLLTAELYGRRPLDMSDVEWHTGVGVRYQLDVRMAMDLGVGRRLTGAPAWYVTVGTAYAFGLRGLIGT